MLPSPLSQISLLAILDVIIGELGTVIVILVEALQLLASETIILYKPALNPVIIFAVWANPPFRE